MKLSNHCYCMKPKDGDLRSRYIKGVHAQLQIYNKHHKIIDTQWKIIHAWHMRYEIILVVVVKFPKDIRDKHVN